MSGRRVAVLLGLVLLVGTLARAPGLWWGYNLFGSERVVLHPDEPPYTLGRHAETAYPRGLSVNVRLLAHLLTAAGVPGVARGQAYDLMLGRVTSLVYGLLTLLVVFHLTRALWRDDRTALLAAFFLALANLHVTYSHIGTPDAAATFWFWAGLALAHRALVRGSRAAALLSAACTGVTAAMRYQVLGLLPLAVWVVRTPGRITKAVLVLGAALGSFYLVNGLYLNPVAVWQLLRFVVEGGALGAWKYVFLPPAYLAVLLLGVGLPVFLLAVYGLARVARARLRAPAGWRAVLADDRLPILLTAVAAFVQACAVGLWAPRHVTIVTPLVAMLAAHGFAGLPWRDAGPLRAAPLRRLALATVALYLGIHVASVQAYFVDDPLEKAGRWLRRHVPPGVVLSVFSAKVPPEYPRIAEWEASYLVLSAQGYRRYFFKDLLPSELTGRLPDASEIYHGNADDARRLQQLFRGELPYRLVKRIQPRFYTPELVVAQAYWYPPPHVNDVLIYERVRAPEARARLLTPARTDYLVTLDTGPLWHPAPGQEIRLVVNGEPLPARLAAGVSHVVLPRDRVRSPYSELVLQSREPLPHLPPRFLSRARPVGRDFAVESLLDADLLAEGFAAPQVGPNGAAWRWTDGAGRILLPRRGTGDPWQRLAAHLQGPPDAPRTAVFLLDGQRVGEVVLTAEPRTVEFALPTLAPDGDLLPLEILSPVERGTGGDGARQGVAVFWVGVTRGAGFHRAYPEAAAVALAGSAWRPLFGLGADYRAESVSFPSGRLTLRADLLLPRTAHGGAIVLAHGASVLGRKHGLYLALARRLAERGFTVLNTDLRGYGESEDPGAVREAADLDFAGDVMAAIDYLTRRFGVREVTVVGHSFGGGVALAAAARDPRVTRVVSISPGRRAYEVVLGSPAARRGIRDRMAGEMGLRPEQFPVELVEPVVVPIIVDSYVDRPLGASVLLVDGELEHPADLAFLRDVARRMRARPAYVTIPGADHYFGIQQQREERDPFVLGTLADVVEGWIREGSRWSPAR